MFYEYQIEIKRGNYELRNRFADLGRDREKLADTYDLGIIEDFDDVFQLVITATRRNDTPWEGIKRLVGWLGEVDKDIVVVVWWRNDEGSFFGAGSLVMAYDAKSKSFYPYLDETYEYTVVEDITPKIVEHYKDELIEDGIDIEDESEVSGWAWENEDKLIYPTIWDLINEKQHEDIDVDVKNHVKCFYQQDEKGYWYSPSLADTKPVDWETLIEYLECETTCLDTLGENISSPRSDVERKVVDLGDFKCVITLAYDRHGELDGGIEVELDKNKKKQNIPSFIDYLSDYLTIEEWNDIFTYEREVDDPSEADLAIRKIADKVAKPSSKKKSTKQKATKKKATKKKATKKKVVAKKTAKKKATKKKVAKKKVAKKR